MHVPSIRRGLRVAALLFGLLMLTATEAAGLRIHGLDPQLKQAIARIADNRAVTVARTPPVLYNAGGSVVALSYQFAPYELGLADQIRISLWGYVINNNAGTVQLFSQAFATNALGGTHVQLGGSNPITIAAAAGNPNKYALFRFDYLFSIGVAGAVAPGENYIPQISSNAARTLTSTYASGDQPLNNFAFFGGGNGLVTDQSLSGAVVIGGPFLAAAAGTSGGSGMRFPITMDNSVPTRIDVEINDGGFATAPVTVMAGYIEVL